jgi:hypothetical protein
MFARLVLFTAFMDSNREGAKGQRKKSHATTSEDRRIKKRWSGVT